MPARRVVTLGPVPKLDEDIARHFLRLASFLEDFHSNTKKRRRVPIVKNGEGSLIARGDRVHQGEVINRQPVVSWAQTPPGLFPNDAASGDYVVLPKVLTRGRVKCREGSPAAVPRQNPLRAARR